MMYKLVTNNSQGGLHVYWNNSRLWRIPHTTHLISHLMPKQLHLTMHSQGWNYQVGEMAPAGMNTAQWIGEQSATYFKGVSK